MKAIITATVMLASMLSLALTFSPTDLQSNRHQLEELKAEFLQIQAFITIDSLKQEKVGKISTIIDRYNPTMSPHLKNSIANEINEMSLKYSNLDIDFICATITHESNMTWDPTVRSYVGAIGLMQLMPRTGHYLSIEEGITWTSAKEVLTDPIQNIRLGCRYMSALVSAYGYEGALVGYNSGPGRAETYLKNGELLAETSFYLPEVMKYYQNFKRGKI